MSLKDKIKKAEGDVNTSPTEAQKEVGNYKKGKVTIKGLKITIENHVGSVRKGKNKDGIEWENEVKNTYGYFNGTVGKDGDHIDLYIGPIIEEEFDVYIIDQLDEETRAFDEHKVMLGFKDKESSVEAYLNNFNENWKGFGNITSMSLDSFKKWIKDADAIKYPAGKTIKMDYKNISIEEKSVFKSIDLASMVEEGITLKDLKEQAGDISLFDTIVLKIASPGGSVSEGLEIMTWLNNLSAQGKFVVTIVTGNAYSIASLIMLAADLKLISVHGKVMVHNPMIPELKYANANTLQSFVDELRDLENNMYDIYNVFTGLKIEKIKVLMDNETYLSPEEAVALGFADEIIDMEKVPYVEAVNIKKEINMSETINLLKRTIAFVQGSKTVNQTYHSKDGDKSIEVYQVDQSTITEGDKTDMKEGKIELADGSKLTIEDSVIKNIDREVSVKEEVIVDAKSEEEAEEVEAKAEESEEEEAVAEGFNEGAAPKEVKEKEAVAVEAEAASVTQISKWETEVVQDEFEVGTLVEYKPFEDGGEPSKVDAGDYELEDGRRLLIDADGIVRLIMNEPSTEAVEEKEEIEAIEEKEEEIEAIEEKEEEIEEIEESEEIEAIEESEEAEAIEEKEEVIEAAKTKDSEMTELKEMVAKLQNTVESLDEKYSEKFEASEKFEDTAAKAIDVLAKNTSTTFKPEARVSVDVEPSGTIFGRLKKARRL